MISSICAKSCLLFFFFFNDTATTEIYTLSLHDALPILRSVEYATQQGGQRSGAEHSARTSAEAWIDHLRSEEHTSELQSQSNLVCRLLLEKKKNRSMRQPSVTANRSSINAVRVRSDIYY